MKRTAFFISDGTGITAESLGRSLLAQFSDVEINMLTKPYIDTVEKAQALAEIIESTAIRDGHRPIIIDTIVDQMMKEGPHSNSTVLVIKLFFWIRRCRKMQSDRKLASGLPQRHNFILL